ncbi:MAG: hypothetical protein EB015_21205 [Methylocystaceae bacterium]|nr:hypothetical protein [Methylocystaceae bacterium]
MTPEQRNHDADLLHQDYISELSEMLLVTGGSINAAAYSGNKELLTISIRQARLIVIEMIDELKAITSEG